MAKFTFATFNGNTITVEAETIQGARILAKDVAAKSGTLIRKFIG